MSDPHQATTAAPDPVQARPRRGPPERDGAPSRADTASSAPTVLADDAAGLPDGTQPAVAATPGSSPGGTRSTQTTVLPRVEFVGDVPRIIREERARYEIGEQLGEGGVGEVFLARDCDIGRLVALKRLRGELTSPELLARFVEEVRTTGRLEHPNIVPIHDVGIDDQGNYYFVMKYVEGETLEQIIERLAAGDRESHEQYGFERRARIFGDVLEAVAYAHAQGFVHRDIKPANVMVGAFGEVLLMDWGIAKNVRATQPALDGALARGAAGDDREERSRSFETQVGALIGTPAYMAPEQAAGDPVDERSDIYSLCVMLHELLTLRHYLAGRTTIAETLTGVMEATPPLATFVPSPHQPAPPTDLAWFAKGGLDKDPAGRFQSVDAMRARLARRAEGDIPMQCATTVVKRATMGWLHFLDAHPTGVPVGLGLLALLVLSGIIIAIVQVVL